MLFRSHGCVPIVSDGAGASEIIINGINGYTFTAGNSDELLKRMNQVAESQETLTDTTLKFTQKFSDSYNWDDFASNYVDLLL